jgi:hypothetical protein
MPSLLLLLVPAGLGPGNNPVVVTTSGVSSTAALLPVQ